MSFFPILQHPQTFPKLIHVATTQELEASCCLWHVSLGATQLNGPTRRQQSPYKTNTKTSWQAKLGGMCQKPKRAS